MTETTRGFCWHQNFVPWGCLPLTCGYIHLLNHEKMCIKSEVEEILFKLATNYHSDEAFLLTSKFLAVMGCLPLAIWLCLNFFSAITADLNISSQGSDTGPMVLWFLTSSAVWALSVFLSEMPSKCIDSGYLVGATPVTVFFWLFWNFADVFCMEWRCACSFGIILWLLFLTFSALWT